MNQVAWNYGCTRGLAPRVEERKEEVVLKAARLTRSLRRLHLASRSERQQNEQSFDESQVTDECDNYGKRAMSTNRLERKSARQKINVLLLQIVLTRAPCLTTRKGAFVVPLASVDPRVAG